MQTSITKGQEANSIGCLVSHRQSRIFPSASAGLKAPGIPKDHPKKHEHKTVE